MYADDLLRNLIQRIRQIERFLDARTLLGNDHDAAFRLCYTLLEELEDPPEVRLSKVMAGFIMRWLLTDRWMRRHISGVETCLRF